MKRNQFYDIVEGIKAQREAATDDTAAVTAALYPTLKGDGALIKADTRINWNGVIKKARADLWDTAQNTPDAAPNLWIDVVYTGGYRQIPNPPGGTFEASLKFMKGEKGMWIDGKVYEAVLDNVVWTPVSHPPAWKLIS